MTATDINNEMFLELVSYFEQRAGRFRFPKEKIESRILEHEKESFYARYRYHEDGAVHCELKIWTEDNTLLLKSHTSQIHTMTTAILKNDINRIKSIINQFFLEFIDKY